MSRRPVCVPQMRRLVCERDDLGELLVPCGRQRLKLVVLGSVFDVWRVF